MAVPIALTIAGSDSGGGAGIQADLKTFSALGVYGASAITAVTAQNTQAVTAIHAVPLPVVRAQIEAVLSDLDVKAIKIGMLATAETVHCVAEAIKDFHGALVLDPVMVAKSGDVLLPQDAIGALLRQLVPRATLITPNLPEAAQLLGQSPARDDKQALQQGRDLLQHGAQAVLIKGGHATGDQCRDLLLTPETQDTFAAPRLKTRNTHGTGCSYSSAIAAGLAKGEALQAAVAQAHHWLHQAIKAADQLQVGQGHGPVHHFHGLWR